MCWDVWQSGKFHAVVVESSSASESVSSSSSSGPMPARRNSENASRALTIGVPLLPALPKEARFDDHFEDSSECQPNRERKQFIVLIHPPAHETSSFPAAESSHERISTDDTRMSAARWVIPART